MNNETSALESVLRSVTCERNSAMATNDMLKEEIRRLLESNKYLCLDNAEMSKLLHKKHLKTCSAKRKLNKKNSTRLLTR